MLQCDAQVSDENPPRHARRFLLLLQEDDANEKRMFSILKRWKTVLDADALGLFFVCLLVCCCCFVCSYSCNQSCFEQTMAPQPPPRNGLSRAKRCGLGVLCTLYDDSNETSATLVFASHTKRVVFSFPLLDFHSYYCRRFIKIACIRPSPPDVEGILAEGWIE